MKTIKGTPTGDFKPILGIASKSGKPFYDRSKSVFVGDYQGLHTLGYAGMILSRSGGSIFQPDGIVNAEIGGINDGDIVRLSDDGVVEVLWEKDSCQNAFLLTEACNCKCLMCPQPPKEHNPGLAKEAGDILSLLQGKKIEDMCITGGEPTFRKAEFMKFLERCVREHPEADVSVLTNGKTFSDLQFARNVSEVASNKVTFCVSLHSDIPSIHDAIVGAKGSFEATENGLYNMALAGLKLEIRHVMTKLNSWRLADFARHIYNYFPFCSHYAFMAMEIHGYAEKNFDSIAVSPNQYEKELREAILYLDRRCLPISIYNIPLCLLDRSVWPFARQSISGWKNIFIDVCSECTEKESCAGFFSTSSVIPREFIKPVR